MQLRLYQGTLGAVGQAVRCTPIKPPCTYDLLRTTLPILYDQAPAPPSLPFWRYVAWRVLPGTISTVLDLTPLTKAPMTSSSISPSHVISFTAFAAAAAPFPASTHALPLLVAQSRPAPSRCRALDLYPRTHPSTAAQLHGEALYAGNDWLGMLNCVSDQVMIKLSVLTLLAFVAVSVHAKPPPVPVPIDEVLLIQDFKANVFDLEFGSANELSPVQTLNHKLRTSAQGWIIEEVFDGLYAIQNYASRSYLSYTGAVTGLDSTSAQLCGHGDPFLWSIIPNANGKNKFNIIEPQSGLAVTSWPGIQSAIIGLTTPEHLLPPTALGIATYKARRLDVVVVKGKEKAVHCAAQPGLCCL
ncbi:hypothetical protein DFH08DRAFT_965615 [Mycena albidolilacea]|uniref:Ricin B lectin domain-containing protein n=1 Tax=Mycena albidolilacea TaxID=1033008 RepID=A0AAD6ZRA3_9AGAR|nr:hypothetical protein DFH08DRAFT_965615 [Mycena albidolilacea]